MHTIITRLFLYGVSVGVIVSLWQWDWTIGTTLKTLLTALTALFAFGLDFLRAVWKDHLKKKWGKALADWLDTKFRNWLSGFRRRYFQQLYYRCRFMNVRGLITRGTFNLKLEKVFVQLRIAAQNPQNLSNNPISNREIVGNRYIWEIIGSNSEHYNNLVITGAPGTGKTTLLQHLTLIFATNQQRKMDPRVSAKIPILLFLRQHIDEICSTPAPSLSQLVTSAEEKSNPPNGWFESKLKQGKCLVMLDGLDEVAEWRKRWQVSEWLEKQMVRYGNSRFIITSRPHGYRTNPLAEVTVLEVQPLTQPQIKQFIENWYLANEIASSNTDDSGVRQTAREKANDLRNRLHGIPSLDALSVNPLLLNMMATVHNYRGQLPGRRIELYEEIANVFLGRWSEAKGVISKLTPAQKRSVLEPLAYHMMDTRKRDISGKDAAEIIKDPLAMVVSNNVSDPIAFLQEIEQTSGLLLEREVGIYSFAHLTFQEFLAACHIAEKEWERQLLVMISDSWWHETTRLYAAKRDASKIISHCLKEADTSGDSAKTVSMLSLAYHCEQEGRSVETGIREQLKNRLLEGLESEDSIQFKMAAEVMLSLRLKNFYKIGPKTEIDNGYISNAEYQLFIDESMANGIERKPIHWKKHRFQRGDAREPIVGISYLDAQAFSEWLTTRHGSTAEEFRLPNPSEVKIAAINVPGKQDLFSASRVSSVVPWCSKGFLLDNSLINTWRSRSCELAIGSARAINCSDAINNAINNLRGIAIDSIPVSDSDSAFESDMDYTLHLAHALGHALDFITDCNASFRNLELRRAQALVRTIALVPALTRNLDQAFDVIKDIGEEDLTWSLMDINNALARAHDLALALANADDINSDIANDIANVIENLLQSKTGIGHMSHQLSTIRKRVVRDVIPTNYLYLYELFRVELSVIYIPKGFFSKLWLILNGKSYSDKPKDITNFCQFVLLEGRIRGIIPAWESIRIVREAKSESSTS